MDIVRRKDRGQGSLPRLREDMSDLMRSFFEEWDLPFGLSRREGWWPAIDIAENQEAVEVRAELPGMKREDIDISVLGNILSITGEKKESTEDKQKDFYHAERRYGTFRRDITLPTGVEPDKISANYSNGILTVTVPKSEQAKPRRIEVKS